MSKEMLMVVDAVANEKGVARSVIFDAMEAALASAAKKRYIDQDVAMRVSINRNTGEYETFRRWEVVADDVVMESPDRQERLMDAVDRNPDIQVGDSSKNRSKTPSSAASPRRPRSRSSCSACAKPSVRRWSTPIAIASANWSPASSSASSAAPSISTSAAMPKPSSARQGHPARERARRRPRARLPARRAPEARGPQLFVSRTAPEFMMELFKLEVPEVGQGLVRSWAARAIRATAPRSR
jgi:N utilization substance protein A